MKRFLSMLMACLLLFCAISCDKGGSEALDGGGNATDGTINTDNTDSAQTTAQATTAATTQATTAATTEPAPPSGDVTPEPTAGFRTGYSRVDITPYGYAVSLNSTRTSIGVFDPIYATCIAVSDGEETVLLITVDVRNITDEMFDRMADIIEAETGIGWRNVIISATHNHSSPDTGLTSRADINRWFDEFYALVPKLAKDAIDDLALSEVRIGTGDTTGMNFVRRYLMGDGSYKSVSTSNPNNDYVAHESEADPELRTVRFVRENAKDIVMVNWQAHAAHALGFATDYICSDFIAQLREGVEKEYDVHLAYFQGACGNINLHSYIPGNLKYHNYIKVGQALVGVVGAAIESDVKVESGKIGKEYKGVSATKSDGKTKANIPIWAFSFGDVAFVSAPYEMFDTNGMYIRENSPFKMTFVCAYANGRHGYMPSEMAFPHGEYEVRSCKYVSGTGEQVAEAHVELLKKLIKLYE